MKNLRYTLGVCVASILAVLAGNNPASAQEKQGPYVTQAAARLTKAIDTANQGGYLLNDNTFSIAGGWLKQSQKNWIHLYTIELKAGTKYRFLAAGDDDAKDVDLEVLDANKKVAAQDVAEDPTATVDFTPKTTGIYHIRIRLYDSRENLPCVCLSILMTKK